MKEERKTRKSSGEESELFRCLVFWAYASTSGLWISRLKAVTVRSGWMCARWHAQRVDQFLFRDAQFSGSRRQIGWTLAGRTEGGAQRLLRGPQLGGGRGQVRSRALRPAGSSLPLRPTGSSLSRAAAGWLHTPVAAPLRVVCWHAGEVARDL